MRSDSRDFCIISEIIVSGKSIEFEEAVKTMIRYVGEDVSREGLEKTPNRVLKAYEFMFGGYQEDPQEILNSAMFASSNDEMVLIKYI